MKLNTIQLRRNSQGLLLLAWKEMQLQEKLNLLKKHVAKKTATNHALKKAKRKPAVVTKQKITNTVFRKNIFQARLLLQRAFLFYFNFETIPKGKIGLPDIMMLISRSEKNFIYPTCLVVTKINLVFT